MEIIQLLNSHVELITHKPYPFANLRSLKILPKTSCMVKHEHLRVIMCTEVRNFLLNGSAKATLTEVLREQCCDITAGASIDSI
ncbi:hypothetical protein QVD17_40537 [Tagetes erecta]|uniref:Uncharacterized protein n=1 Tax=Tagetes erecta TaxID=13708 RepID=A0AAD8JTY1_TARER|nr:hypothetical protein QVD17_40537 [Tagetes erecta]